MTKQITYRNRKTDEMISEPLILPRIQYAVARSRVAIFIYNIFLNTYPFCWLLGKWMDLSGSRKKIRAFVQKYDINLDEIELPLDQYKNLNAFFSRKLKPDARPFISRPPHLLFTRRWKSTRISQTGCTNPPTRQRIPCRYFTSPII